MAGYKSTAGVEIPIIDTDSPLSAKMLFPGRDIGNGQRDVSGVTIGYGYVPRDYSVYPQSMYDPPSDMKIYPESDWDALYDEEEAQQSSLEHIYLSGPGGTPRFVNLDQDGDGYCWAYSTGQAIMLDRLVRNMPLVRLNPHSVAAIIKKGRDEGGWCGLSGDFARRIGYGVEGTGLGQWPLHSRDLKYDTPELRKQMELHKTAEEWCDMTREVYDQNITRVQCASSSFARIPGPRDYNHWSHSVLGVRWVRVERGSWGQLILNSWLNWGRFGLAVLSGSKAVCDGGLCIRQTTASIV